MWGENICFIIIMFYLVLRTSIVKSHELLTIIHRQTNTRTDVFTYSNVVCRLLKAVGSREDPAVRNQSPSTETITIRPMDQNLNTHRHTTESVKPINIRPADRNICKNIYLKNMSEVIFINGEALRRHLQASSLLH